MPGQAANGAPDMRLCTPLVARQEASAADVTSS